MPQNILRGARAQPQDLADGFEPVELRSTWTGEGARRHMGITGTDRLLKKQKPPGLRRRL